MNAREENKQQTLQQTHVWSRVPHLPPTTGTSQGTNDWLTECMCVHVRVSMHVSVCWFVRGVEMR